MILDRKISIEYPFPPSPPPVFFFFLNETVMTKNGVVNLVPAMSLATGTTTKTMIDDEY